MYLRIYLYIYIYILWLNGNNMLRLECVPALSLINFIIYMSEPADLCILFKMVCWTFLKRFTYSLVVSYAGELIYLHILLILQLADFYFWRSFKTFLQQVWICIFVLLLQCWATCYHSTSSCLYTISFYFFCDWSLLLCCHCFSYIGFSFSETFFLVAKLCMKWQFDELVVQAFKLKSTSKQGRIEIESFTHFLSEMLSSLKVNPTFFQYITLLFPYILFLIWVIISQNIAMASQISEGSLQSFGRVWKSVGTDWGK